MCVALVCDMPQQLPPARGLTEVKEIENHLGALKLLIHTPQQCGGIGAKLENQKLQGDEPTAQQF